MAPLSVINDLLCSEAARLILAVLLVVGIFALLLTGHDVPTQVWMLATAAVAFYFGGLSAVGKN